MNIDNIKSHAFGDTHEIVLKLAGELKKGSVLDVAAGEGALTRELMRMGFNVTPADLEVSQFGLNLIKPDQVDLNEKLKYENNKFDHIMCIETIEHVINPGLCLSEFYRILKPSGILILSTPNISSLISRIIYLFTGQYANFFDTDSSCIDKNGKDRHIMPLPSWLLMHHLNKAVFKIDKVVYSNGGIEIPTKKRPWKKIVFLPHTSLFGNSVIIRAQKAP